MNATRVRVVYGAQPNWTGVAMVTKLEQQQSNYQTVVAPRYALLRLALWETFDIYHRVTIYLIQFPVPLKVKVEVDEESRAEDCCHPTAHETDHSSNV